MLVSWFLVQTVLISWRDADGEIIAAEYFEDPSTVENKGGWLAWAYCDKILPQPRELFRHTGAKLWHGVWDRGLLDCMARRLAGRALKPYVGDGDDLFYKRIMQIVFRYLNLTICIDICMYAYAGVIPSCVYVLSALTQQRLREHCGYPVSTNDKRI